MKRKAANRRNTRKPTRAKRPTRIAWRPSAAVLLGTAYGLGWAILLAGSAWGLTRLEPYVNQNCIADTVRLEWTSLPAWLQQPDYEMVRRDIERSAGLRSAGNLESDDLTRHVAEGLEASPWVSDVQRVAKLADGRILVTARFREPLAYVDINGRAYCVDAAGVRVLDECSTAYIQPGKWFTISGVQGSIPRLGEAWKGDDVKAGLKLVQYLVAANEQNALPFASWIRGVDVANFDRRVRPLDGRLRIQTINPGCYINWGEPPGEAYPVEPSADRKLAMLNELFAARGELPAKIIDVRSPQGVRFEEPRR